MDAIDNYFTDITGQLSPRSGQSELQRFYGAYAAYANQALLADAGRFGRLLTTRKHQAADSRNAEAADAGWSGQGYRPAPATGDSGPGGAMWGSAFGSWNDQDSRAGLAGYDYDSHGLALGYEYHYDRLSLGLAAAFSKGDLKVSQLGYKNEAEVLNLALYGLYSFDNGFYASGALGYGHAWNDYRVNILLGGSKSAEYGSDLFSADLELGYQARLGGGFSLIPSIGLEYNYVAHDSWAEKLHNNSALVANRFQSGHESSLDIPLSLRANKLFELDGGGYIKPELQVAYVYAADKSGPSIESGFKGAPGGMEMRGVDPGRSHWRLGAGLTGQVGQRLNLNLEYELETGSGFTGHNLGALVGWSF